MSNEGLYDRGYIVNYTEGDEALYRTPMYYTPSTSDIYHTIKEEESLLDIAIIYYDTHWPWYLIADANDSIEDIFDLTEGETIVIPNMGLIDSMYA